MSVRSRAAVADRPVSVGKGFGPGVPESFRQGEAAAQMTPASAFSPGQPIGPYDGYDRTPRSREFVTGYNIATRPRTHERVAFETLKGLFGAYDVARICVRHRIASLRSLEYKLTAAEGWTGDVAAEVAEGKRVLKRPDHKTLFKPWLAKYLRDVLSFDAGTLYKMRNRAGRAVGLKVVDGTMIAPLLDYWGDRPEPPAEAFVQYVNGLPWNWLTENDLIYEPYDPQPDSIYGTAPLEDVLLNANTDLRFQLYFLQRFTDGNLPAGFASAPDGWSPDQIEQFQEYWDAFMLGNQAGKHQIRWIPSSKLAWTNEKDFTDSFSLFLMRKTCSAYSVVPADLGFTEDVNRSSGESQADVQHRVGDLPMALHVQDILSSFLQDDLQLPLDFKFDLGEEQDDRVDQANADKIYFDMGAVGSSEIRELRYGWSDPVPVPRTIMTSRGGPVPIASLLALAGEIDPATSLPALGAALPKDVFGGVEGTLPEPPLKVTPLAEREYGPSAMPPAPPPQPQLSDGGTIENGPVAKEGEGAAPAGNVTAGITSETGIYSYDLDGRKDDDDEDEPAGPVVQELVAKEMAAFRRFAKARRHAGEWRDFEFRAVPRVRGHNLNDGGRLAVRKDAGQVAVAGLAVLAADTGRVLLIQRALDDQDPAAGTWEAPGGHLENGESPLHAAWREWSEETGLAPPPGVQTGSWASADGIYQGIVWTTDAESLVPVRSDAQISNPDDPDGDSIEAIAWWDPETLPGNPAVRPELLANIDEVMAALGCVPDGDEPVDGEPVTKALERGPKVRKAAKAATWPGWALDLRTAGHWSPSVAAAAQQALSRETLDAIAADYAASHQGQDGSATGKRERNAAALAWLKARGVTIPMGDVAEGITADGLLIGGASAKASAAGENDAGTAGWQPGDTEGAKRAAEALGLLALLAALAGQSADDLEDGYLGAVAGQLAGWDADDDPDAGDLGGAIADAVADEDLAGRLVIGQICIIAGKGAMGWYLANGKPLLQWVGVVDSRICPACLANVNADPRPAGAEWPSGDTGPPAHPGGCRCGLVVSQPASPPPGVPAPPAGPDVTDAPGEDAGDAEEPEEAEETGEDESDEEPEDDAAGEGAAPAEQTGAPATPAAAAPSSSLLPLAAAATAAAVADRKKKQGK